MNLRIGIIGTGAMGRPVVDRLNAAGHQVAAYARSVEARDALRDANVELVDSVSALATGRDIVVLYVFSDEQVREVALDDGLVEAMDRGSTLVIHTTGSPATAQAVARRAAESGVGVLDAPGSGGPEQVADGALNLFVGGADDDLERCRPALTSYANRITHFGPLGSGQIVKLLNNLLFGAHVELAVEAARLADGFGIDVKEFAQVLHTCSGQSFSLDLVASMGSAANLLTAAGPYVHKDVAVACAVAAQIGAPLGTFDAVAAALLDRTRGPHHGDQVGDQPGEQRQQERRQQ